MKKQQKFKALCDIIIAILDSYRHHSMLPSWIFRFWYPDDQEIIGLKQKIRNLQQSILTPESADIAKESLITLLETARYRLSVQRPSNRLRTKVQDALLEVLFFHSDHIKQYQSMVIKHKDINGFLDYLKLTEEIEEYKDYYRKQHSIYGRFIYRYSEQEIELAAKGSMINGQLIERYGIKGIVSRGLAYIRYELNEIERKHKFSGYLTKQTIDGYLGKMTTLLSADNEIQQEDAALIQNARYLLDDIINAVVGEKDATAKNPSHQRLITACYWVDEMLKVARGRIEAEAITLYSADM